MIGTIIFHLLIVAAGVFGIMTGYRKGIRRQIGAVIALAFAIVAAHILGKELFDTIWKYLQIFPAFNMRFIAATLSAILIFIPVYFLLRLCLFPLGKLMKVIRSGVLDSIFGAVFRLFNYLVFLSLAYNLLIDIDPTSSLAKSSRSHDGNLVEGVVKIAPALMNFPDGEEVVHYQQLEDAKKIS